MAHRAVALLLLPLLAACAATPRPAPVLTLGPAAMVPATPPEPPVRPFPARTLESLLVAEFAAQRQRPDVALDNYVAAATETRDPNVVARATTIAQVLNQPQSLDMARLWTEVSPQAPESWFLLSLNALRQRQFDIAIPALDRLLALQPEADLEQLFVAALPPGQADRDALYSRLAELARSRPDNANLQFGLALLRARSGQPAEALDIASRARRLRPDSVPIALLQARMLTELSRSGEAADLLRQALRHNPDSNSLRLNLARALIRAGQLDAAETEFKTLLQRTPEDGGVHLALALVAYENHHDDLARRELEGLQSSETLADQANYYLGQLALRQQHADEAIAAFERVQPGDQYLPALAEISRLLGERNQAGEARRRLAEARSQLPELAVPLYQLEADLLNESGDPDAAWKLLSTALGEQPGNPQLLLSRALAAEQLNRLDAFETDIRDILRREPDNPSALNALGYTLADRGSRLDEAETLIRRAYALKPDDPSIMDSLGWVKYRRGDRAGALVELRRAYALFPDDEVAAHLGEVLWILGQRDEARRIWGEALRQHPRSKHIPSTRARLESSK